MSGFNSFALDFSSEALMERLQLCRERLETFSAEGLSEESGAYFRDLGAFALEALEVFSGAPSAGEHRRLCSRVYGAPEAPMDGLGAELGLLLSVWYGEFRDLIRAACEKNLKDMTVLLETFLQLLTAFEEAWAEQGRLPDPQEIKDILYSYVYDYCLEFTLEDLERALRPAEASSCRWLWDADFGEPDWIYEPGLPVTEAECRLAADFGGLSEELLRSMAEDCREEALRLWQEAYGRTAPPGALFLRFPKAAAPLGRAVARQLQAAGFSLFLPAAPVHLINRGLSLNPFPEAEGEAALPFRQCHREDLALFLGSRLKAEKLRSLEQAAGILAERTGGRAELFEIRVPGVPAALEPAREAGTGAAFTTRQKRLWESLLQKRKALWPETMPRGVFQPELFTKESTR